MDISSQYYSNIPSSNNALETQEILVVRSMYQYRISMVEIGIVLQIVFHCIFKSPLSQSAFPWNLIKLNFI